MARTVAEIDADIARYEAARNRILDGLQSFSSDGRAGAHPELASLEKSLAALRAEKNRSSGRGGIIYPVPL